MASLHREYLNQSSWNCGLIKVHLWLLIHTKQLPYICRCARSWLIPWVHKTLTSVTQKCQMEWGTHVMQGGRKGFICERYEDKRHGVLSPKLSLKSTHILKLWVRQLNPNKMVPESESKKSNDNFNVKRRSLPHDLDSRSPASSSL